MDARLSIAISAGLLYLGSGIGAFTAGSWVPDETTTILPSGAIMGSSSWTM